MALAVVNVWCSTTDESLIDERISIYSQPCDSSATERRSSTRKYGSASSGYIRVEYIAVLFEELKTRGAPFGYELTSQTWGMNEMQIDDPYGNAIRFGEEVKA
jgi:uncharacterized glyoxalase superfamily protein PhnB